MAVDRLYILEYTQPLTMSPKEMISLRLDPALLKVMRAVKAEEGIPVAVQLEKAAGEWLERRGLKVKAAPRRAQTRRRA